MATMSSLVRNLVLGTGIDWAVKMCGSIFTSGVRVSWDGVQVGSHVYVDTLLLKTNIKQVECQRYRRKQSHI
jgi:hypothetical protein